MSAHVVTVFGSASPLPETAEYRSAYELGTLLAQHGFTVCNGGYGGTMEATARGASEAGGRTVGIITDQYPEKEANPWIGTIIRTPTALDRLLTLVQRGSAYVILPGGTGTLLELAMVWELMNKQTIEQRPAVLLGTFWDPIVDGIRAQLVREGRPDRPDRLRKGATPRECVDLIAQSLRGDQRP